MSELLKSFGFFAFSFYLLLEASYLESNLLPATFFGKEILVLVKLLLSLGGLLMILFGLISEAMPQKPTSKSPLYSLVFLWPITVYFLSPLLSLIIAVFYLRRVTIGLEKHLKRLSLGFFLIAVIEFLSLARLFEKTTNVDLFNLISPFGPLWIIKHLLLVVAILVLGSWVFSYLLERFSAQLFFIFNTTILLIFLLSVLIFTSLLLKNIETEALRQLATDAKVLSFSLDSKKEELIADGQLLAKDAGLPVMIKETDKKNLKDLAEVTLLTKKEDTLIVTDESGRASCQIINVTEL